MSTGAAQFRTLAAMLGQDLPHVWLTLTLAASWRFFFSGSRPPHRALAL